MIYIIITDIFNRKSFDIISLIKYHFPDYKLLLTTDRNTLSAKILYGNNVIEKLNKIQNFDYDLNSISAKYSNDQLLYIPVEEDTNDLFIKNIEQYGVRNFIFKLPRLDKYSLYRNKKMLNEYCNNNSFPAPRIFHKNDLLMLYILFY